MCLTVMGRLWQARDVRELPAPHAGVVDVQYPSNHSVDFALKTKVHEIATGRQGTYLEVSL